MPIRRAPGKHLLTRPRSCPKPTPRSHASCTEDSRASISSMTCLPYCSFTSTNRSRNEEPPTEPSLMVIGFSGAISIYRHVGFKITAPRVERDRDINAMISKLRRESNRSVGILHHFLYGKNLPL